jgi:hypothetical protein
MDVEIGTLSGTVRALDSADLLSPKTLEAIVAAVMAALEKQRRNESQAKSDTQVTRGVASEQEHGR